MPLKKKKKPQTGELEDISILSVKYINTMNIFFLKKKKSSLTNFREKNIYKQLKDNMA